MFQTSKHLPLIYQPGVRPLCASITDSYRYQNNGDIIIIIFGFPSSAIQVIGKWVLLPFVESVGIKKAYARERV